MRPNFYVGSEPDSFVSISLAQDSTRRVILIFSEASRNFARGRVRSVALELYVERFISDEKVIIFFVLLRRSSGRDLDLLVLFP